MTRFHRAACFSNGSKEYGGCTNFTLRGMTQRSGRGTLVQPPHSLRLWRGCDTSRCMPRRRSSRNSLTSRGRRFDSRLDVNAQQITCRRIVGRRAAKRFARLREVARIAAGFEVTGFARIDPVLRRAEIPKWSDSAQNSLLRAGNTLLARHGNLRTSF